MAKTNKVTDKLWQDLITTRPAKQFTQLRPSSLEYLYAIMSQAELLAEKARLEKQLSNLKTFIK